MTIFIRVQVRISDLIPRSCAAVAALLLALLLPAAAMATNGMNMIGYGAVSPAMGGADLAIVDNATAMNINPAGLCKCLTTEVSAGFSLLSPKLNHQDRLGNDRDGEDHLYLLPLLTYARPMNGYPVTFGLGFFSQGGMGAEFKNLATPFAKMGITGVPAQDKVFSNVSYAKLTPTLAWRPRGTGLTLGVSLNLGYVGTEMKFFPDTSVFIDANGDGDAADAGDMAFAGMDLHDTTTFAYGARVGFQYEAGAWTFGGAYLSQTDLDFDDGEMTLNLSSVGLGEVDYDARMRGFNWPQQAGLGVSWRPAPRWRLAADVDWVNWSRAMRKVRITLDDPDNPAAPARQEIVIPQHWKDQWVFAIGLEYFYSERWIYRLGYNHGDSPVPDKYLTPLFPAIIEDHVTAGVGFREGLWLIDAALEWALPARQSNDNPDPSVNPFGPGLEEEHSQITTHLMVRRLF